MDRCYHEHETQVTNDSLADGMGGGETELMFEGRLGEGVARRRRGGDR